MAALQRPIQRFDPAEVHKYFAGAGENVDVLRQFLPRLFATFQLTDLEPAVGIEDGPWSYSRKQLEILLRDIDEIFEIRANSELAQPVQEGQKVTRIFIGHGRSPVWREVQAYIEKDLLIPTVELAQEPNLGRTVLQKLEEVAMNCSAAVIVVTADDHTDDGTPVARQNVIHEVGYFQGKYGLNRICLLHEEGTTIPSNIHGLVYAPFPAGLVSASFHVLGRELRAIHPSK